MTVGSAWLDAAEMGTGCWQWGDRFFWGYGRGYAAREVRAAFEASLEAGITLFDTAEGYGLGLSERNLGAFVRAAGRPVRVATKFLPLPWRLRKRSLLGALRASLERLGLDRVDLYQIHWPMPPMPVGWWADALADAVEAGLTSAVGVSNFSAAQTRRAHAALARRGVPLASNQVHYSLLNRSIEQNGVREACQELNVKIIAYSPLEKGMLSGKYSPQAPPPGVRRRQYGSRYLARIQPLLSLLRNLGAAHRSRTPGQVALNWLMCQGALPIPGAKDAEQVRQNAGALGWRLSPSEVAALDAASDQVARARLQA